MTERTPRARVISSRRERPGAGEVRRVVEPAVGPEPADVAVVSALDRPAVLVDEPVVERADEDEVLEVGRPAVAPPHDVVGLREPARAAAGEPAFGVAVAELAQHRRRRLPGQAPEAHRFAGSVLEDALDPRVAQEPPGRLRMEPPTVLDQGGPLCAHEIAEPRVDDHGRTV